MSDVTTIHGGVNAEVNHAAPRGTDAPARVPNGTWRRLGADDPDTPCPVCGSAEHGCLVCDATHTVACGWPGWGGAADPGGQAEATCWRYEGPDQEFPDRHRFR